MRGKTPFCAMTAGTSPCSSVQPFRQPTQLMAAQAVTKLLPAGPHRNRAASANGALECASVSGGTSSMTAVEERV